MKETAITGIVVQVEVTTYNAEGQVANRPQPVSFMVLEAEIPAPVKEWLWGKIQKGAN